MEGHGAIVFRLTLIHIARSDSLENGFENSAV
jgi:hypothetical protein